MKTEQIINTIVSKIQNFDGQGYHEIIEPINSDMGFEAHITADVFITEGDWVTPECSEIRYSLHNLELFSDEIIPEILIKEIEFKVNQLLN